MLRIAALLAAAVITACAVGPDFKSPDAPAKLAHYTATPLAIEQPDAPGGQTVLTTSEMPARWWSLFGSQPLDSLIERALVNSLSVAAAKARLLQVQENLNAQVGSVLYPSVDGKLSTSRNKISGASFGGTSRIYSLHNASLSLSYGVDLFGASTRYLEGLEAQIDYEQYQLQAARLTLVANLITAAVKEASLRGQIEATRQVIADSEAQLAMVEQRLALGAVAQSAVLSQRTAVAQNRTALPTLLMQLQQNRHLLNVLAGVAPSDDTLPEFTLATLHLPETLPLSLPSELVRQRPDIMASEALLHQASADIGLATANMYPRITLTGSYGSESPTTAGLFGGASTIWGVGAGLVQPLFHGGELRAKKRQAVAAYDQAQANYRQVVLQSFRDVADTLLALEMDGKSLNLQQDAEKAAREIRQLVEQQYQAGSASYLELLNANQQYQQSTIALTQARAAQLADSAALVHALGGGWWKQADSGDVATENKP
ncbi:MAG: RND transporter [Zetaproteobacteria bacterium CG12_big_fil_rev_8_21_14_0_65_54_13]|nr:MAG: RND transporter [Zetaproteobacteria bacterium CG12_big_fil_rev_8_21_14_0_65_54_13]